MSLYTSLIYPAVLVDCLVLAVLGIATLIAVGTHRFLQWAVTATYVVVALQVIAVAALLVTGAFTSAVITVGYLLATLALLPLMGIGRLGTPDAAAASGDPSHPVLAPDQVARVDAGAAILVAIALAVASWRIVVLLEVAA